MEGRFSYLRYILLRSQVFYKIFFFTFQIETSLRDIVSKRFVMLLYCFLISLLSGKDISLCRILPSNWLRLTATKSKYHTFKYMFRIMFSDEKHFLKTHSAAIFYALRLDWVVILFSTGPFSSSILLSIKGSRMIN